MFKRMNDFMVIIIAAVLLSGCATTNQPGEIATSPSGPPRDLIELLAKRRQAKSQPSREPTAPTTIEEKIKTRKEKLTEIQSLRESTIPIEEETPTEYILGGDDIISVTTERHPEFTGVVIITQSGRVSFPEGTNSTFVTLPFWKELKLIGITEDQLEQEIAERLKKYLYEPRVIVSVIEYGSKKYYVVGEVLRPGRYAMRGSSISLMEAIFAAGLPTPRASLRRARIIGPDPEKPVAKKVNLYTLLYKGDLKQNLTLLPGDVVYVPSTVASKWNTVLDQLLSPASKASSLQSLYYQFDMDYYRRRYEYDKWYYTSRPGYSR